MRILKWLLVAILVLVVLAAGAFTAWAYSPLGPAPEALAALESDNKVAVELRPWITFRPTHEQPTTGLILYPGGRVDPRSYAPAARAIAEQGYLVVIPPMPFNLAVIGANRADEVIAAHPEIQNWSIGGHSLGGAMAAAYAHGKPEAVEGLVLWAAYPADNNSLSDRDLKVTSIFGSNDGLATPDKIAASRALLPPSTVWARIVGGNHAQFGAYGPQSGDGQATIDPADQQEQVVAATIALLEAIRR
jgi:pimeloyl-ACP methyl ester carboxylesterase